MKNIRLDRYSKPEKDSILQRQKKYQIFWAGEFIYFKNEKDCKRYLSDLSTLLNLCLAEMNSIYSFIFVQYRELWFYIDTEKEIHIKNYFKSLDFSFDRIMKNRIYENYHTYTYKDLKNIKNYLIKLLEIVRDIHETRNNYSQVWNCNAYIFRLMNYEFKLEKPGSIDPG